MSFGSSTDWQDAFGEKDEDGNLVNMPLVTDNKDWPKNLTNFMGSQLATTVLENVTVPTGSSSFVFYPNAMQSTLLANPSNTGITDGWAAYFTGSTVTVPTGATLPGATGGTLSGVGVGTVIASSIVLGKTHLAKLATAALVAEADKSEFPKLLQEACRMITYTVTGTNAAGNPINATVGIQ